MSQEKTYKQKLRDLALYTEAQLASWTESQCKGEYYLCLLHGKA